MNQQVLAAPLSRRYGISAEFCSRYPADNGLPAIPGRDVESFLDNLGETRRLCIDCALSTNRRGDSVRRQFGRRRDRGKCVHTLVACIANVDSIGGRMKQSLARLGNRLYTSAPAFYGPIYSLYKAISDRAERRLIAQLLAPGMTVIDVGANIGVYTRFFAGLVTPSGKVIAIAPDRENFRRLAQATTSVPGVTALHAAAADVSGTCTLYMSGSLNVDHQTYDSGQQREAVTVPARSIDDLVEPGSAVDFIKMDIQGAEAIALRGAARVLAENPGIVLLFEYWPDGIRRSGHDPEELLAHLRGLGFKLDIVGGGDLPSGGEDAYCNIVARRPSH